MHCRLLDGEESLLINFIVGMVRTYSRKDEAVKQELICSVRLKSSRVEHSLAVANSLSAS